MSGSTSEALGALIRQHRRALRLSQTEVAELLGRSQTMVSENELGGRWDVELLAPYARVLRIQTREICGVLGLPIDP